MKDDDVTLISLHRSYTNSTMGGAKTNPTSGTGKTLHSQENNVTEHRETSKTGESNQQLLARSRLEQLSSHLAPKVDGPSTSHSRRKGRKAHDQSNGIPSDYSDVLENLESMKSIARTPNASDRGYVRQLQAGKLWVRERIEKLLVPGSFREVGSAAGSATWRKDSLNPRREHLAEFIPSNNPQGFGLVMTPTGKRTIYLTADDFSLRAGHADGSVSLRSSYGEKLALKLKIPVVKLTDGSSGGGSVSTIQKLQMSYIPLSGMLPDATKQLNMGIPNLGACLGPAIGLGAARVVSTHFNVMAADVGSLFNAGPKVVESATFEEGLTLADLGGSMVHCTNGTFDNVAPNEEGCLDQLRTMLGYLPDCGAFQSPPVCECTDSTNREDINLRSIIPRKKNRMYNSRGIITSVVDQNSWFEIGPLWGRAVICGLARLGGRPVGIISSNCEVNGGTRDAAGSQKLMKHLKLWYVIPVSALAHSASDHISDITTLLATS
jgi:acetyl-CoA carboxylase carboxyltransferase component